MIRLGYFVESGNVRLRRETKYSLYTVKLRVHLAQYVWQFTDKRSDRLDKHSVVGFHAKISEKFSSGFTDNSSLLNDLP